MEETYRLIFQFHTPDELRFSSTLVHWIIGGVFATVATLSLAQIRGYLRGKTAEYLSPILILTTSIILLLYLSFHHGLEQVGSVWQIVLIDPQQRQHVLMGTLFIIASLAELRSRMKKSGMLWRFVWPAVTVIIGVMFLLHPQHGTREAIEYASTFHTYLGISLTLAGSFLGVEVLWGKKQRWLSVSWIAFLFLSSILLLLYREPEGTYTIDVSNFYQMEKIDNETGHQKTN